MEHVAPYLRALATCAIAAGFVNVLGACDRPARRRWHISVAVACGLLAGVSLFLLASGVVS